MINNSIVDTFFLILISGVVGYFIGRYREQNKMRKVFEIGGWVHDSIEEKKKEKEKEEK